MEPTRKRAFEDPDGYMTEAQLSLWITSSGIDMELFMSGESPEFEKFLLDCKKYNYLYDLSIANPEKVIMYYCEKSESIDFSLVSNWPWGKIVTKTLHDMEMVFENRIKKSE